MPRLIRLGGNGATGFTGHGLHDSLARVSASIPQPWIAGLTFSRIDPDTNEVVATVDVEAHAVTVGQGAVWVSTATGAETVARIDPETNRVTAEVDVTGPNRVAAGEGAVGVVGVGRVARIEWPR